MLVLATRRRVRNTAYHEDEEQILKDQRFLDFERHLVQAFELLLPLPTQRCARHSDA
jgi:hypothetical protein